MYFFLQNDLFFFHVSYIVLHCQNVELWQQKEKKEGRREKKEKDEREREKSEEEERKEREKDQDGELFLQTARKTKCYTNYLIILQIQVYMCVWE